MTVSFIIIWSKWFLKLLYRGRHYLFYIAGAIAKAPDRQKQCAPHPLTDDYKVETSR